MATFTAINSIPLINPSRNPIRAEFKVTPWGANEQGINTRLMIKLSVERDGVKSNKWVDTQEIPVYPDANGIVSLDVQYLIDGYLEFYIPDPKEPYFQIARQQSTRFLVKARIIDDYEQSQSYVSSAYYAFKGGVARKEGNPQDYLLDSSGKMIANLGNDVTNLPQHADTPRWITLFCREDSGLSSTDEREVEVTYTYVQENITGSITLTDLNPDKKVRFGQIIMIPAGIRQKGLPDYITSLEVVVNLKDSVSATDWEIHSEQPMCIEYRNHYDYKNVFFHTSLGGLVTQRLVGPSELSAEYEKQTITRINPGIFANRNVIAADDRMFNSLEREQMTAESGFVSKENLMLLRDLLKADQAWTEHTSGRLLPITITAGKTSVYKTEDDLFSLSVKWEQAWDDLNFNPDKTAEGSCPKPLMVSVSQTKDQVADLYWKLPDGYYKAQIQWANVLWAGASLRTITVEGNEGVISLACDNGTYTGVPQRAEMAFVVKVICKEGPPMETGAGYFVVAMIGLIRPLTMLNGFANTYTGAGQRVLKWQNNSEEISSLVNWIPTPLFGSTKELRVGNWQLAAIGSAGGSFVVMGLNSLVTGQSFKIKYTPPSATFEGVDIIPYTVREVIGPNQTPANTAKLYVKVQGANNVNNGMINLPYIQLIIDWNTFVNGLLNLGLVSGTLYFFADPLGNIPLNVSGLNLPDIVIGLYDTNGGDFLANAAFDTVVASPNGFSMSVSDIKSNPDGGQLIAKIKPNTAFISID